MLLIVIHTTHQRQLESQVHYRKREDDMEDTIKMSRYFVLYVMYFIYSFVIYLLKIVLRCQNFFSK